MNRNNRLLIVGILIRNGTTDNRFAQIVQHPLGEKQPGPAPWNLVQPAQIRERCTDQVIGAPFGKQFAAQVDHIREIHVKPLNTGRRIDSENTAVHSTAHLDDDRVRVIGQKVSREGIKGRGARGNDRRSDIFPYTP
jgi:hypothetical protein